MTLLKFILPAKLENRWAIPGLWQATSGCPTANNDMLFSAPSGVGQ